MQVLHGIRYLESNPQCENCEFCCENGRCKGEEDCKRKAPKVIEIMIGVFFAVLILGVIIYCIYICYKKCKNKRRKRRFSDYVDRMEESTLSRLESRQGIVIGIAMEEGRLPPLERIQLPKPSLLLRSATTAEEEKSRMKYRRELTVRGLHDSNISPSNKLAKVREELINRRARMLSWSEIHLGIHTPDTHDDILSGAAFNSRNDANNNVVNIEGGGDGGVEDHIDYIGAEGKHLPHLNLPGTIEECEEEEKLPESENLEICNPQTGEYLH